MFPSLDQSPSPELSLAKLSHAQIQLPFFRRPCLSKPPLEWGTAQKSSSGPPEILWRTLPSLLAQLNQASLWFSPLLSKNRRKRVELPWEITHWDCSSRPKKLTEWPSTRHLRRYQRLKSLARTIAPMQGGHPSRGRFAETSLRILIWPIYK